MSENGSSTIAHNRRARYEYEILETFEAGLSLTGTEVKSARAGGVNLREGYVRIEGREAWLVQVHISPFSHGHWTNHEPDRKRRLLLHRREIVSLSQRVKVSGLTLVPMEMYMTRNHIKLRFGLGRGKKLWDKRQSIAERDARRESERTVSEMRKG